MTSVAAAGSELMTLPATMVSWLASVASPAARPAAASASSASASGRSTRSGTATVAGPWLITRSITVPCGSSESMAGSVLMTPPAGISSS